MGKTAKDRRIRVGTTVVIRGQKTRVIRLVDFAVGGIVVAPAIVDGGCAFSYWHKNAVSRVVSGKDRVTKRGRR